MDAVRLTQLVAAAALWVMADTGAPAAQLPRRSGPEESYPGVTVRYDSIADPAGHQLRLIVTHPEKPDARVAVIFVAGWLSCDTVEAPAGTHGAAQQVFRALAQLPGFATVRMDKAGVGDSQGDCAATDFSQELAAYRAAFRRLADYPFVDTGRIFIFGLSNGGGFAPLVAAGAPVRGYVVVGGWLKTWFEHMLEIERRRLVLSGVAPAELNARMVLVEKLYSAYLLQGESPQAIFARAGQLRELWEGEPSQQYGRPVRYYQQLQELDLMKAWSAVSVPVLVLHGEFDWIMSRSDLELMASLVNHNAPGAAAFMELPGTGHTLEHFPSQEAAFAGRALPFDAGIAGRISAWFEAHR